jgi:hypothetical protein
LSAAAASSKPWTRSYDVILVILAVLVHHVEHTDSGSFGASHQTHRSCDVAIYGSVRVMSEWNALALAPMLSTRVQPPE